MMNPIMKKRIILEWFRRAVQLLFFIFFPSLFHAGFTGVKNIFTNIGNGQPLTLTSFTTQFLILVGITMLFGRYFCGWACSFGAINDWIYAISAWVHKKLKRKAPAIPEIIADKLIWLKYVVLLGIIILCFRGEESYLSKNSPWTIFSLFRLGHFKIGEYLIGFVLLCILMVGMMFEERFFCHYFCPFGAIFSLIPFLPVFILKRKEEECPGKCNACKKVCPVKLRIEKNSVKQGECIRCGRCSVICPRKNIYIFRKNN